MFFSLTNWVLTFNILVEGNSFGDVQVNASMNKTMYNVVVTVV